MIAGTARMRFSAQATLSAIGELSALPDIGLLLQLTVVQRGARTTDGHIIEAVTLPWFEIVEALQKDPQLKFKMPWELLEEIVAGAYKRAGFEEVIITPRSGDHGRDVIATKHGLGTIRVIESVKRYGPSNPVGYDDVRALLGVLDADGASKGFLSITSTFAPGLPEDRLLKPYIGPRLELIDGTRLLARLKELAKK
jgi:restriction system protein